MIMRKVFTVVSIQGKARIYTATDYLDGRRFVFINNWWDDSDNYIHSSQGQCCEIWSK